MNNLPLKPVGGVCGEAGGVCVGAQGAPSANFQIGSVGFGPHWTAEDSMAASIIRLEQENQELRAEVALLREQARIMQAQANELRELLAEIVFWIEGDLRDTVDASYRKAVERAQKLTEGLR